VWHNATQFANNGQPLIALDPGNPIEPLPQRFVTGSRLTTQGVVGLNFAVVIVDGTRTNGAGLAVIADYVAMAGLAELDLQAKLEGDPTILRLFTTPQNARPPGLTSWDQAFLSALYHAEQAPRIVQSQIAGTMAQDVSL
jgi:hypothetical protein